MPQPKPWRKTMKVSVTTRRRRVSRHNTLLAALPADLMLLEPLALDDGERSSQNLVRWEIAATTESGPYTLSTCFPSGRLVQIFERASAALARQAEIQEMLVLHAQRSFLTTGRYGDGRRHL
jgi:hypothetical protein